MNQIKALSIKLAQQAQYQSSQMSTTGTTTRQPAVPKINMEGFIAAQNLIFSITNLCLDSLSNYIPNLADYNYACYFDEFKLLPSLQSTPPSSFDSTSGLSFGSIIWMTDYSLRMLQKVQINVWI